MFNSIDHIEIVTQNMKESVEFYTNILGFKMKSSFKPRMRVSSLLGSRARIIVYLTLGDTTLELLEFPKAGPIPSQPPVGYRMMAVSVDDMHAAI